MLSLLQRLLLGDQCGSNPALRVALGLFIVTTTLACIAGSWLWWSMKLPAVQQTPPAGCRRLGRTAQSNLADEHSSKYWSPSGTGNAATWKVKSLWIYPVKSCKGIELDSGAVCGTGMEYDRRFSFARYIKVSKPGELEQWQWKFITQRDVPMLATIKTELWIPDPSSPEYSASDAQIQSGGRLIIRYPTSDRQEKQVNLPYDPNAQEIKRRNYQTTSMNIWRDSPDALMMATTEANSEWMHDIQAHLGISTHLALFRVRDMFSRQLFRNAPRRDSLGYQPTVGFQDAYPLHILGLASVLDVASQCDFESVMLSARNFRPNIIVTGGEAYAEDKWKRVQIGHDDYHVACRTVRCLLPNVNQDTGERRSEPNKALKSFRCVDKGDLKNACLGMQMVPASANQKILSVGDEIRVLETGEHLYIKI